MYNKSELLALAEDLLGSKIYQFNFLEGGSNNVLAKIKNIEGSFVIKAYSYDEKDNRDRLNVEYSFLSFLWENNVRFIPEPIAINKNKKIGIYRYIEGIKSNNINLSKNDIFCLSNLLHQMWDLRKNKKALNLPNASDCCFSFKDYVNTVENRFEELSKSIESKFYRKEIVNFLKNDFFKVFDKERNNLYKNDDFKISINNAMKTLSPSDIGFINAIKTKDNHWIFLDFEYAGWDDPTKMIADAIQHPGMPIPERLCKVFIKNTLNWLDNADIINRRLKSVIPIVGLKWCLIILKKISTQEKNIQNQQFLKAKLKLKQIKREISINKFK